jgi:hypothetical protein
MLRVTVDIFSGRPNPEWIVPFDEARRLLHNISETPEVIEHADPVTLGLGYRGLKIDLVSDDLNREMGLPASFRLLARTERDELIVNQILRSATSDSAVLNLKGLKPNELPKLVRKLTRKFPKPVTISPEEAVKDLEGILRYMQKGGCKHEEILFDSAFWNDPAHMDLNNCYNLATNRRTDNFAQPGFASTGHLLQEALPFDCALVQARAISDGAIQAPPCPPDDQAPRYLMALVLTDPDPVYMDYHWYRRCSDGLWAHKPGGTPARNYDNNNDPIYDPETCDRGDYTTFCGYLYAQKKMVVAGPS